MSYSYVRVNKFIHFLSNLNKKSEKCNQVTETIIRCIVKNNFNTIDLNLIKELLHKNNISDGTIDEYFLDTIFLKVKNHFAINPNMYYECPICLENKIRNSPQLSEHNNPLIQLFECKHILCKSCALHLLHVSGAIIKCPLCRKIYNCQVIFSNLGEILLTKDNIKKLVDDYKLFDIVLNKLNLKQKKQKQIKMIKTIKQNTVNNPFVAYQLACKNGIYMSENILNEEGVTLTEIKIWKTVCSILKWPIW